MKNYYYQKANALIVALMLVVIIVASVTVVVSSQKVLLYRTKQAQDAEQTFAFALGVELWAKNEITNYLNLPKEEAAKTQWPIVMPNITYEYVSVSSAIFELQGLYNINQVEQDIPGFSRLLSILEPDFSQSDAMVLARNVAIWESKKLASYISSDLLTYYAQLDPPYQVPHQLLSDKSELLLIKGFTPELYAKLEPYVIALPTDQKTAINLNTVSVPVLMSINPAITEDIAQQIIDLRNELNGFSKFEDLFKVKSLQQIVLPTEQLTLTSSFFMVSTVVKYQDNELRLNSFFEAKQEDKQITFVLFSRSLNPV